MSADQRADLDSCTCSVDCQGDFHLMCCPSTGRRADAEPRPERQTWKRIEFEVAGAVEQLVVIDVDDRGIVQIEEAVLAQLLIDAGWERTA